MKYLVALLLALLVPTAAVAKGECKEDAQKFCKDVVEAKEDPGACLKHHMADLSEVCKTKLEAKAKKNKAEGINPSAGTLCAPFSVCKMKSPAERTGLLSCVCLFTQEPERRSHGQSAYRG